MHVFDLLTKTQSLPHFAVAAMVGEDTFLTGAALRVLLEALRPKGSEPLFPTRFEASEPLARVMDELRLVALFESRRVILIESADTFVTAHRKALEDHVERPSGPGVLILAVKTWPATTRLAKLVEKNGVTIDTRVPNTKALQSWLPRWAKEAQGVKLDEDAAALLLELVGPEVAMLASEVEKLSIYVAEKHHVRRADVAALVGGGNVQSIWQVLNAATVGQSTEALGEIDRLLASGEHPVGLLAAMAANLRKVHHAGMLRLKRWEPGRACQEAGIPPFAVDATVRQHKHLGPKRVEMIPRLLIQCDLELKGSSALPPRAVIEKLIVNLASPRSD